jgi:predicted amidohydrolase
MRIAVHHGTPDSGGVPAGLASLESIAEAAALRGARLLVLPQLFLSGRPAEPASAAQRSGELSDGPAARRLSEIAVAHGLGLLCGYAELCSGRLYDAALFVDDRGIAIANYRRIHLVPEQDEPVFTHGQWLTVVPFHGLRLGLLIGADLDGPEQARSLALAGAAVLLVAGGHGPAAGAIGEAMLRTRAAENGCALAFANGDPRPGAPASCVVGADGSVLATTSSGGLAVAEIAARGSDRVLARDLARRPRLYQRLVAPLPGEEAPRL